MWFLHAEQDRFTPLGAEKWIEAFHKVEALTITYVFELEGGSAGKWQERDLRKICRGRPVKFIRRSTDKVSRQGAISSDVEGDMFIMFRAGWNAMLINHLVNFPSKDWHDDLVDAAQIAHQFLTVGKKPKAKVRTTT
jgi:predicted phage terminase large subunit-like protein